MLIKQLLKKIENATGLNVYLLQTEKIEDCIIYTITSNSDNGAVAYKTLELRIISKTMEKAEEYRKKIFELITIGDEPLMDGILSFEVNGGGLLFDNDTETIHTIVDFELIMRSEK